MGILPDWMIRRDIKIEPFSEGVKRNNTISFGLSSYGYDMRLGYRFRVIKPYPDAIIDPKNYREDMYEVVDLGDLQYLQKQQTWIDIPAHSFVLGESMEEFTIPRDILCIVMGKSTYARCGQYINVTPLEPDWVGKVTLEISNTTPKTARVYAGEGICQCLFLRTDGHSDAMLQAIIRLTTKPSKDGMMPVEMINELLHKDLANGTCKVSYADKSGKYQNQTGIMNPTIDKG